MTAMWIALAALCLVASARSVVLGRRTDAHLRYLQQEVASLGGEDRWNVRCNHCGKPIRDRSSIRYTTKTVTGEVWVSRTDGVFHLDRPGCSAAAGLEVDR